LDFLTACGVDFVDDGEEERCVVAGYPSLFAMLEACAKGFAGTVGKMRGGIRDGGGR
jgi:hypothetical protein